MNGFSQISALDVSGLSEAQGKQVNEQWMKYVLQTGADTFTLHLGDKAYPLKIDPLVANPRIMNSGLQVAHFLCQKPELVIGKTVVDMGTGCGVIGIMAALLGASKVFMPEIDESAVACASRNLKKNGLTNQCEAFASDLFSSYDPRPKADVQIFNHPFFSTDPLPGSEWTRIMLGGTELLGRYFQEAVEYSHKDTVYILPWLPLAGNENGLDNDPGKRAPNYGFEVIERVDSKPVGVGVQQSQFVIYVLRHKG